MKFMKNTIHLSETKLRNIIKETISETLINEGFMEKFYDGFEKSGKTPTTPEEAFSEHGWRIVKSQPKKRSNGMIYAVKRQTGAFGAFNGTDAQEMANVLTQTLNGNGVAVYLGEHPKYPYISIFRTDLN